MRKKMYYCDAIIFLSFNIVISRNRFKEICSKVRFDIRSNRSMHDKEAAISLIWTPFIECCKKNFVPFENLTVDEQLCNFRGRVKFRTYIPTKPGKYGIKIWCLADAKTSYLVNAQIYLGKVGNTPESNQGERIVRELCEPVLDKGYTITTDNFFTTMNLARYLKSRHTALVGTIKKSRRFLPSIITEKSRETGSMFLYHDNITICRYSEKPGKYVLLLSSQHQLGLIEENNKPEIVNSYNASKAGVDTLDQLVRFYTTKRRSKRWPVVLFYNMVDIAAYNAYVLFCLKYPEFLKKYKSRARRNFIKRLTEEIDENYVENVEEPPITQLKHPTAKGRCTICARSRDRKSKKTCHKCDDYICVDHYVNVCMNCL